MSDQRRTYKIKPIVVNKVKIVQVVIDPHYEKNHGKSMNDSLVLALVNELDGRFEIPETKQGRYSYYSTLIGFDNKQYRLIWLLEDHSIYIGVINAYRDNRRR